MEREAVSLFEDPTASVQVLQSRHSCDSSDDPGGALLVEIDASNTRAKLLAAVEREASDAGWIVSESDGASIFKRQVDGHELTVWAPTPRSGGSPESDYLNVGWSMGVDCS